MARYWFGYLPGGSGTPPYLSPDNYVKLSGKPNCPSSGEVCAVYSYKTNANLPVTPFSDNLRQYFANGFTVDQPDEIGAKIFVYFRSFP